MCYRQRDLAAELVRHVSVRETDCVQSLQGSLAEKGQEMYDYLSNSEAFLRLITL